MTIAVIWQEDDALWCAADTRLSAGDRVVTTTEVAAKIYSIPIAVTALDEDGHRREPHYRTQYGFVYAGAMLPASQTAITAVTFLQNLARAGNRTDPPKFEQIADFVGWIAKRYVADQQRFERDGHFVAALFGWCPHELKYKIARIECRTDSGSFRTDVSYPPPPLQSEDPWVVLGDAAKKFDERFLDYKLSKSQITKRIPRHVVDAMVAEGSSPSVGGGTSIGRAYANGFDLFYSVEPVVPGQPAARLSFNGLDMDLSMVQVGQYHVDLRGIP